MRALKLCIYLYTLSGKRQAYRTTYRLRQRDDEHTHVVKVSQQAELLASIAAASGPAATRFSRRAGCKTHHAILALDAHAEVAPFHKPLVGIRKAATNNLIKHRTRDLRLCWRT